MKSLLETSKSSSDCSMILEDFPAQRLPLKLDENDPTMSCQSDFTDIFDAQTCQDVQAEIEAAIQDAAEKKICSQIIYPPDLVSRITNDVLRMSVSEPCGVRGCAIYITLQEKDRSHKLATIFGNPLAPPTFEIHLILKEDDRSWKKIQKVYYTLRGGLLKSHWTVLPKMLYSTYHLEKRRLYRRSNSVDSVNA